MMAHIVKLASEIAPYGASGGGTGDMQAGVIGHVLVNVKTEKWVRRHTT